MNTHESSRKFVSVLTLILVFLLFSSGLLFGSVSPVRSAGPYVVDITSDGPDSNLSDGNCYDGVNGCSLRAAIQQATHDNTTTTITFWSGISGQTITLQNSYGQIVWDGSNITVNGESKNIKVSGQNLAAGQSVFRIRGSNNTLRYLTIRDAPQDGIQVGNLGVGAGAGKNNVLEYLIVIGNDASGIYVNGGSEGAGSGNKIQNTLIGVGSSFATACVTGEGNGFEGIYVDGGADDTVIKSNRVVCNGNNGITLNSTAGGTIANTSIEKNDIGTDGGNEMGNGLSGIRDSAGNNTQVEINTISGNGGYGVWLDGSTSADVLANYIGVNNSGSYPVPNKWDGVLISNGASGNSIGDSGNRNYISGNNWCGVAITGGSVNNVVDGNYIGVDSSGTAAIPNGYAGVGVFSSNNNTIGSASTIVVQVISGNTREGVYVGNSSGTFIVQSNRIGVASDFSTSLGNGLEGIMLSDASSSYVRAERIAYNGKAGVAVMGVSATGNRIEPAWAIYSNGGLPIDLGADGATLNDTGDGDSGPNGLLNYPVITGGSGSNISGTVCNNCTVLIYQAIGNPAAAGGGGQYLQYVTADLSGNWNATLSGGLTASSVTMTTCEFPCVLGSNTSEMSPRPVGYIYLPIVRRN